MPITTTSQLSALVSQAYHKMREVAHGAQLLGSNVAVAFVC
jgi:hypothetical protein